MVLLGIIHEINVDNLECAIMDAGRSVTYTKSTDPKSCRDRFITDTDSWFNDIHSYQECYPRSEWETRGCLNDEEMSQYMWDPYSFTYPSCADPPNWEDYTSMMYSKYHECCMEYYTDPNSGLQGDNFCSSGIAEHNYWDYNAYSICDARCSCSYNSIWDDTTGDYTYKCMDNVRNEYNQQTNYGLEDPWSPFDARSYCNYYMNETCCNSFKDIASYTTASGIEAAPSYQQLCKWTASLHTYDEWDSNTNSYKQVTYDYGWCQTDHENLNNIKYIGVSIRTYKFIKILS